MALKQFTFVVAFAAGFVDHAFAAADNTVVVRDISKRGLCTPTGPGVCNFGVEVFIPPFSDIEYNAFIYDRACNQIGFSEDPYVGSCIYSSLPWAVCIRRMQGGPNDPSFAMAYSNTGVDSEHGCSCSGCSSGLTGATCCQCAFNC